MLAKSTSDQAAGVATLDWALGLWGSGILGEEWEYDPHRSWYPIDWKTFQRTNPGAKTIGLEYRHLETWLATIMKWAARSP